MISKDCEFVQINSTDNKKSYICNGCWGPVSESEDKCILCHRHMPEQQEMSESNCSEIINIEECDKSNETMEDGSLAEKSTKSDDLFWKCAQCSKINSGDDLRCICSKIEKRDNATASSVNSSNLQPEFSILRRKSDGSDKKSKTVVLRWKCSACKVLNIDIEIKCFLCSTGKGSAIVASYIIDNELMKEQNKSNSNDEHINNDQNEEDKKTFKNDEKSKNNASSFKNNEGSDNSIKKTSFNHEENKNNALNYEKPKTTAPNDEENKEIAFCYEEIKDISLNNKDPFSWKCEEDKEFMSYSTYKTEKKNANLKNNWTCDVCKIVNIYYRRNCIRCAADKSGFAFFENEMNFAFKDPNITSFEINHSEGFNKDSTIETLFSESSLQADNNSAAMSVCHVTSSIEDEAMDQDPFPEQVLQSAPTCEFDMKPYTWSGPKNETATFDLFNTQNKECNVFPNFSSIESPSYKDVFGSEHNTQSVNNAKDNMFMFGNFSTFGTAPTFGLEQQNNAPMQQNFNNIFPNVFTPTPNVPQNMFHQQHMDFIHTPNTYNPTYSIPPTGQSAAFRPNLPSGFNVNNGVSNFFLFYWSSKSINT